MSYYEISIAGLGPQPDQKAVTEAQAATQAAKDLICDKAVEIWAEGRSVLGRWAITVCERKLGTTERTYIVERVANVRVEIDWRVS